MIAGAKSIRCHTHWIIRFGSGSDEPIVRLVIEPVDDELKNICQMKHLRHRSFANFIVNVVCGLAAYCFLPKKSTMKKWNHLPKVFKLRCSD